MQRHLWRSLGAALALCAAGCGEEEAAAPAGPALPACYTLAHTAAADWQPAFDAASSGAFLSVWGRDLCEVYAVGGQPEVGVAFRFDGAAWSRVPVPAGTPLINWVYGVGDTLWMVGNDGTALRGNRDGMEAVPTGAAAPLWGVWGSAPDQVWAVGGDVLADDGAPVMLRWDGQAWAPVALPDSGRGSRALFKVWGAGGDDFALAVGHLGLAYQWDGQRWALLPSGTGEDLISLWGSGPDQIGVIGGRNNGVLGRWDGGALQAQVLAGTPGLSGIWSSTDGALVAVGDRGTIVTFAPGQDEPASEESGTDLVLHGVWGSGLGPRFAVGGSLNRNPPYTGVVLIDP